MTWSVRKMGQFVMHWALVQAVTGAVVGVPTVSRAEGVQGTACTVGQVARRLVRLAEQRDRVGRVVHDVPDPVHALAVGVARRRVAGVVVEREPLVRRLLAPVGAGDLVRRPSRRSPARPRCRCGRWARPGGIPRCSSRPPPWRRPRARPSRSSRATGRYRRRGERRAGGPSRPSASPTGAGVPSDWAGAPAPSLLPPHAAVRAISPVNAAPAKTTFLCFIAPSSSWRRRDCAAYVRFAPRETARGGRCTARPSLVCL